MSVGSPLAQFDKKFVGWHKKWVSYNNPPMITIGCVLTTCITCPALNLLPSWVDTTTSLYRGRM